MTTKNELVTETVELMKGGVYDPHRLFDILYHKHVVHYAKVREAIHIAKGL